MERRLKLIALKPLRYAGKSLLSGDEFEASAKDAKLLKAIRKAEEAAFEPELKPQDVSSVKPRSRRTKAGE